LGQSRTQRQVLIANARRAYAAAPETLQPRVDILDVESSHGSAAHEVSLDEGDATRLVALCGDRPTRFVVLKPSVEKVAHGATGGSDRALHS
jgi:hypothetical protein